MEGTQQRGSRENRSRAKAGKKSACILILFLLLPAACDTCVTGTVSQEGVPLEGVRVELNGDGCPDVHRYTNPYGEYCFEDLPTDQNCVLSAWFDEHMEVPFNTGEQLAACGSGFCRVMDLTFMCEVQDPLEPNNAFEYASMVDLPYSTPLTALCPRGDVDFYRVEIAEAGKVLVAETFYPGTGSYLDTYIGLMDSEFNILETDDRGGSGSYSKLVYLVPEVGIYYVAVTRDRDYGFTGDHRSYGVYGLDIRLAEPGCARVIVRENGQPLEGTSVRTLNYPYEYCDTDASGSCCFDSVLGDEECYRVYHPSTSDRLELCITPEDPGTCQQGNCAEFIADFNYTCVRGTVTRNGQPVDEARVRGPYGSAYTGTDGLYCLRAAEGKDAEISVRDPVMCEYHYGVVLTGADGSCTNGGCDPLDFELPDLSCVEVTVVRDGEPVEAARIYTPSGCQYSVMTGADGKACFPAETGEELLLRVEDPMFDEEKYAIVQPIEGGTCEEGGCTKTTITLTGKACASGTVYGWDGEPAANVSVRRGDYGTGNRTQTDENGHYCITVPKGESVDLRFLDVVYDEYRTRYVTAHEGGSCELGPCAPLDVTFPAASCMSGRITRADGEPPIGTRVCLRPWNSTCVEPDQEGLYCLRAPVQEQAEILVEDFVAGIREDQYVYTGAATTCSEGGCTEFNFELPGVACVNGVVTRDSGNGTGNLPEEGAQVCLGYTQNFCVETGTTGDYCLPAETSSSEHVEVVDPVLGETTYGHVNTNATGSCGEGDCVALDLQLPAITCISGVVREGTTPLEGAEVSNRYTTVYTDQQGRYCVPTLADRDGFYLLAEHPAEGTYIVEHPDVGNGGSCNEGGCTTQDFTFD